MYGRKTGSASAGPPEGSQKARPFPARSCQEPTLSKLWKPRPRRPPRSRHRGLTRPGLSPRVRQGPPALVLGGGTHTHTGKRGFRNPRGYADHPEQRTDSRGNELPGGANPPMGTMLPPARYAATPLECGGAGRPRATGTSSESLTPTGRLSDLGKSESSSGHELRFMDFSIILLQAVSTLFSPAPLVWRPGLYRASCLQTRED